MNTELLKVSYTLENIDQAVKKFREVCRPYYVFAFSGEMGAGKTTFIHKLCDLLHVEDTVSSPTFALINEYHFRDGGGDRTIYHLDWYRLKDSTEAFNAGMEECIDQAKEGKALCFIEWPEKAKELLQEPFLWISIESTGIGEREMTVTLAGPNQNRAK